MILGVFALGLVLWQLLQAPGPERHEPSAPQRTAASAPHTQPAQSEKRQEARDPLRADPLRLPPKRVVEQMRILDQRGDVLYRGRVDLQTTLQRIVSGGHYPHRNDGAVFQNRPPPGEREPLLPRQTQGYYREYVHPTPGESGPGPQRVVVGRGGEFYYTPDHYQTFIPLQ